jgi:23S rRNA pseudouridine2457 synthase
MAKLILFNKPFEVLSQFTDARGRPTLADFIATPDVYPAGRLDYDSEGLLLLTDDGALQDRIANPRHGHWKTYLAQLEGSIDEDALQQLRAGPVLADGPTKGARVREIEAPELWERARPIRKRRNQPTSWIEIQIREGRNRQVRRMGAAVGFPVLRLVRTRIGDWSLDDLGPGQARTLQIHMPRKASGGGMSAKIRGPKGGPSRPSRGEKARRN